MKIKPILILIYLVFFSASIAAKEVDYANLYHIELLQIETYLNNLHNFSAKFTQESENNTIAHGSFLLSRPGKMRIEYQDQNKVLIVVNGSILAYKDLELDETSYLTTNSTPASLLTRKNISFNAKDIKITNIVKSEDQIKISLLKKNRKEAGEFTLIFKTNPLEFFKMEVKNDLAEVSTIILSDLNLNPVIEKNMFVVRSPNLPK
jgi:outer membrane lipoprotein carrier protein